eukprot:1753866-Alexandrium_andersonii.AAC.1
MDLLAAERAKEEYLLSLFVEHQAQSGVGVSLAREASEAVPGALWRGVKFGERQFGLRRLGEWARGSGRDE